MSKRFISTLLGLALVASACAPMLGTPSVTATPSQEQEWEKELDVYLTRLSNLGFRGSVLVAHEGGIILSKGYGFLGPNGKDPITPDTLFAIGSNTKPFTAAAILKLQDQGLLNVNDSISRFFAAMPTDKARITIHQLLTHTSGLDSSGVFNGDFENVSRDDAVNRILKSPLLFPPGEGDSYSDYGFILLAAIVERASGKSYQEYMRSEILELAGMTQTGWWGSDPVLKGQSAAGSLSNLPGPYWALMGAGGMVSTVSDLYRWHQAMQAGKILSDASLHAYSRVQFRWDEKGGEGYGWTIIDEPGHRIRAHAGGTPQLGHNNVIRWHMDDDILFIASTSNDEIKAEDVVPNLARIVSHRPYQLPPLTVPVEASLLDQYVGRYQIADGNVLIVTRKADELLFTAEGQQAFDMLFKNDLGIDIQTAQTSVVKYLNAGTDAQLQQWKKQVSQRLGEFKEFRVLGTAAPYGNGEPWTYVSFVFERGNALTRWIVSPAGALQAAMLTTEPPYMVFLAQSERQFVPFSLNAQPSVQAVAFTMSAAGTAKMTISVPTGKFDAPKIVFNS